MLRYCVPADGILHENHEEKNEGERREGTVEAPKKSLRHDDDRTLVLICQGNILALPLCEKCAGWSGRPVLDGNLFGKSY